MMDKKVKLIAVLCCLLVIGFPSMYLFGSVAGQSSNTFTLDPRGGYSGAPAYTGWISGVNCYIKDRGGAVVYSGSNHGAIIEECLDALAVAGGGVLYLESGVYDIQAMNFGGDGWYCGIIMSGYNVWLVGDGYSTVLRLTVANSRVLTMGFACTRCQVRDLCVDGQNLNVGAGVPDNLIDVSSNYDCKVVNCFVLNGGTADGLGAFMTFRTEFSGNLVSACQHGIALENATRCIESDNQVTDCDGTGYLISQSSVDNRISNCMALNCGQYGFEVVYANGFSPTRNSIVGCSSLGAAWSGLSISGGSQTTVSACHFDDNAGDGIRLSGSGSASSTNNMITGCSGNGNGQKGLVIDGYDVNSQVSNCQFLANSQYGISAVISTYISCSWNGTGTWID